MTKEARHHDATPKKYIIRINSTSSADDHNDNSEREGSREESAYRNRRPENEIIENQLESTTPPEQKRQISDESSLESSTNYSPNKLIKKFFHKTETPSKTEIPSYHNLIDQYDRDLKEGLIFLGDSPKNIAASASHFFRVGQIYKKLALVDDLYGRDHNISIEKRVNALIHFDKAINRLDKECHLSEISDSKYREVKATYHATKAKCLYDMKEMNLAFAECSESISVDNNNGLAHEVMGYLHRTNGAFTEASKEFASSSKIYSETNDPHYVISVFHESIALAALGNQVKALLAYDIVTTYQNKELDMGDQIFLQKLHNPTYQILIIKLAAISQNKHITPEQKSSLEKIASTFDFESFSSKSTESTDELNELYNELERKKQELEESSRVNFKNQEKLANSSRELEEARMDRSKSDISTIIHSDTYRNSFYKEVQSIFNDSYRAIKMVELGWVPNAQTGNMGKVATILSTADDLLPVPKVFSLPLRVASLILGFADDRIQEVRRANFVQFVNDADEMEVFAQSIASELTISLHNRYTETSEIKNTKTKDIKKLAKADALYISNFIIDCICNGDINLEEIDGETIAENLQRKVDQTLVFVEAERQYKDINIDNLPKYILEIADLTLGKIKVASKHWHNNERLEKRFIEHLASNINNNKDVPEFIEQEEFAEQLSQLILKDDNIITHQHKAWPTFKIWKLFYKKDALLETFLSKDDYFDGHVKNAYYFYHDGESANYKDHRKISADDFSMMLEKAITNKQYVTEESLIFSGQSSARQSDGTLTPPEKGEELCSSSNINIIGSSIDESNVDFDECMITYQI